jgi:protein SCO1/2
LLIGCSARKDKGSLPYYNSPDFTPLFLSDEDVIKKTATHKIGAFSFLNQDSQKVTESITKGKIHVANFIFTRCGSICPTMTSNLKLVDQHFGQDADLVYLSFSVTPWIDRPYVLKNYKQHQGIENANWHFLTGDKAQIYALARQSYFAEEDLGYSKDSTEFLHTEHILLIDKSGRIRGIYNGTLKLEMNQLIEDIEALKEE